MSEKQTNKTQEINQIILHGTSINLTRLGIDFKLNEQQIECLEQISNFLINKTERVFTLMGYAGTGKTTITKVLLKWIDNHFKFYDYAVTAPTHRAKCVIELLSGEKAKTLHSLLGLMPNLDVEKLNIKNLKFNSKKKATMPLNLLIVDEASQVNDLLNDIIFEKSTNASCQVLYIGDKAQLKPVEQNHTSSVFEYEHKYELTKVERQKDGNPLGSILFDIRNNHTFKTDIFPFVDNLNSKNEGLICLNKSGEFLQQATIGLNNVINQNNFLHSRILTFTNDRSALYNKLIRKKLGFSEKEYSQYELLMGFANVGHNEFSDGLINSNDYIITNKPLLINKRLGSSTIKGYNVDLTSTDKKTSLNQFIISTENSQEVISELAEYIENVRLSAIFEKNYKIAGRLWRDYYTICDSFLSSMDLIYDNRVIKSKSIDYGYSITIHKSQGGTFNTVYVDHRDIDIANNFDKEMRNQLLYVAMSRCSNQVVLFY